MGLCRRWLDVPRDGASSQVPVPSLPPAQAAEHGGESEKASVLTSISPDAFPALVQTSRPFLVHRELLHPRKAAIDDRSEPH